MRVTKTQRKFVTTVLNVTAHLSKVENREQSLENRHTATDEADYEEDELQAHLSQNVRPNT